MRWFGNGCLDFTGAGVFIHSDEAWQTVTAMAAGQVDTHSVGLAVMHLGWTLIDICGQKEQIQWYNNSYDICHIQDTQRLRRTSRWLKPVGLPLNTSTVPWHWLFRVVPIQKMKQWPPINHIQYFHFPLRADGQKTRWETQKQKGKRRINAME